MLRSTTSRAVLLALLFLAGSALSAAELRDVVYLKNGSVVRGIIVEQIPNKTLKIQTADSSVFVLKFGEIERIAKEATVAETKPRADARAARYRPYKEPVLAGVMSFFVPGTGQFYNGQWMQGAAHIAVAGASAAWTIFRIGPYKEHMRTEMYVGAAVYGLNLVLATVDAPLSAIRLNRAHGYVGFKHQLGVRQATLAPCATDDGRGVGVGFRMGL